MVAGWAPSKICFPAFLAVAAVGALTLQASAEVRITDRGSGYLIVEARAATLQEVLESLSRTQNIQFNSSAALSRMVSGTYSGSLQRVLSRLLDGLDTVIHSSPGQVKLTVFDSASASRVAQAPTALAAAASRPVSSNVDLDEEKALGLATPAPRSAPANLPVRPAAAVGTSVRAISRPAISSNVDLDEEAVH